jgi:methyl-accepting chemotaxis protein
MRFTVKAKLATAFGVVILLSAIAGGIGYMKLTDLVSNTESLVSRADRRAKAIEVEKELLQQIRAEKNSILATGAEADQYIGNIGKLRETVVTMKDEVHAMASEEGKKLIEKFAAAYERMNAVEDETLRLARTDKAAAAERSIHEGRKTTIEALEAAESYVAFAKKGMETQVANARDEGSRAETMLIILVVTSLLIGVSAATWIALNISRALSRAVGLADAVAIGDLSQEIDVTGNDEVGDLIKLLNTMTANLNAMAAVANEIANGNLIVEAKRMSDRDTLGMSLERMVEKLRQIVAEALTAAQNVSSGSQELSASAEQLSQGATEQASSAEEASSSMEEMAANVKQNADNANQTEKIAAQSAKDAEASGAAVGRAVQAMQTIAEKITIVQEIARQTDLCRRCRPSPRRSPSCRKSPARPTSWP